MNTNSIPPLTANQRNLFYAFMVAECPSAPLYIHATYHRGYLTQAQLELFIKRINQPCRLLPIYSYALAYAWQKTFNPN